MAFDPSTATLAAPAASKFDPNTAKPTEPAAPQGSWLGNELFGAGAAAGESFGDTMLGAQELIGHALNAAGFDNAGGWLIDDAQKGVKKLKGEAEPYRKAAPIGALAGDITAGVPLALGVGELGIPGAMTRAAAGGAVAGGLQPTSGGDGFLKEKAEQVAGGAALGGAAGAVGHGISRAIAPQLGPDAAALAARGVQMTPGQIMGGVAKRAEGALASVPVAGNFVRGAQRQSIESFNRAVIDDALVPIGAHLPQGIEPGRAAVEHAANTISDAYNRLLPQMTFRADWTFAHDLANLRNLAGMMPPDQAAQFQRILVDRFGTRAMPNGVMTGQTMKQLESELGHFAAQYRSSADAAQRQLGDAVRELQSLMRQTLMRQNPGQATELQNINSAFARLVRVEGAAGNRSTSGGVFTPGDLLTAIKRADGTSRKAGFATGRALGQPFADAAQRVLPPKVPDSGTPERAMWAAAFGGTVMPKTAAGLGAATLPYTGPALRGLNRLVQPAGPVRQGAADLADQIGILTAPGAVPPALRAMMGNQ